MRIDFYVIQNEHPDSLFRVAARLLEKAYHEGLRTWVLCGNKAEAETLDTFLWTYKKDSFLPHCLDENTPEGASPLIQIGTKLGDTAFDILLNLQEAMPDTLTQVKRVLDLVAPHQKEAGRLRYKAYQAEGFKLHHHSV